MPDKYYWMLVGPRTQVIKDTIAATSMCNVLFCTENEGAFSIRDSGYAAMKFKQHDEPWISKPALDAIAVFDERLRRLKLVSRLFVSCLYEAIVVCSCQPPPHKISQAQMGIRRS